MVEKCSGFDEEYGIVVAGYCILADAYVEVFWEVERYDWNEVSGFEFGGMFADGLQARESISNEQEESGWTS